MVALSLFFSQAGQALWSWRVLGCELTVTNEGMLLFVSVAVKSWLSVLVSGLLVATTRWPDLLLALRSMRLPTVLINTLALMVRYLGVLVDEALRMQAARDSRSAGPGRSVIWRARVLGGMIGSLFIRSLERSERIYAAMLARGFAGELRSLTRLSWRARDTWAGMACSLALLSAVLIGRAWR
jgi:cobalt/nickel transport system permease protein